MENVPELTTIFGVSDLSELDAMISSAEQNYNPEWDEYFREEDVYEPSLTEILQKAEMDEQIRKWERRAQRIRDCGSWSYSFDIHNGLGKSFQFHCGMYRLCQSCLTRRAELERKHCAKTSENKELVYTTMSPEEANRFARKHDKDKYTRYPQLDGVTEIMIIEPENVPFGVTTEKVDKDWVAAQDWESIVFQPEGRNRSGLLCLPPKDKSDRPFSIVDIEMVVSDAPQQETLELMKQVVDETSHMRPHDQHTVMSCFAERMRRTTTELRKRGYSVRKYWKRVKLEHDHIDWSNPAMTTGAGGIFCESNKDNTKVSTVFS